MNNDDQPNIPVGQPAPFSAIRRTIINTFKIGKSPKPAEPIIRPEGLDTRLDPALAADLDTLDPNGNEALQVLFKVTDSIGEELAAIDQITCPVDLISEPRRIVIVAYWIESEINNGGLAQYYLNSSGDNAGCPPSNSSVPSFDSKSEGGRSATTPLIPTSPETPTHKHHLLLRPSDRRRAQSYQLFRMFTTPDSPA